MSMYNMMNGTNPYAAVLLALLGFTDPARQIPRLRDCYVDADNNVVVFTRTGGGNRAQYESENEQLRQVPGFLRDEDWDTDSTYAKWVYQPADQQGQRQLVAQLAEVGARSDPTEKFNALMADLRGPASKPSTQAALRRAQPLMDNIRAAIAGVPQPGIIKVDGGADFKVEG